MSTYYYACCNRCREVCDMLSSSGGGGGHLANSNTHLPHFLFEHGDHLESVEMVSEHDDRSCEYSEFQLPDQEVIENQTPPKLSGGA